MKNQMKARFALLILLANAAALAAGWLCIGKYWSRQNTRDHATTQQEINAWRAKAEAPDHMPPSPPRVVFETNDFHWSQLESTNYRVYIANLRGVGCPERTIKDIIITDVMRLYAQRRGQFAHNGRPFKYWETNDKYKLKQAQLVERDRQLAQIDRELPAVLRELLGINYERELNKYFVDADEDGNRLGFLSDDKRDKILALRDEFEAKRERLLYNVENGKPSTLQVDQLHELERQQDDALAQLLSPQEKDQYELSTSPTSDRLRQQLIGFNPSESEFRALYAKQKAIDEAYEFEDTNDATVAAAKAADLAKMMNDFKAGLAGDRIAQFDRSQDPEYQSLTELSEQFDLPADASDTLIDMRQAAEQERQKLLSNTAIPADRLEIALQAIQAETEKAARQTLGEQAFAQYQQTAAWIKNLGKN